MTTRALGWLPPTADAPACPSPPTQPNSAEARAGHPADRHSLCTQVTADPLRDRVTLAHTAPTPQCYCCLGSTYVRYDPVEYDQTHTDTTQRSLSCPLLASHRMAYLSMCNAGPPEAWKCVFVDSEA